MRCIFCKEKSDTSKSIEHVIPESLGNVDHFLPQGIVCDKCNNYFSRKVEAPLLNSQFFRYLRSRQFIKSKKGNIPPIKGIIPGIPAAADAWILGKEISFSGKDEKSTKEIEKYISRIKEGKFLFPIAQRPCSKLMSRFLAKIAIEALTQKLMHLPNWEDAVIDKPDLDPIREYARRGQKPGNWIYHQRNIYK